MGQVLQAGVGQAPARQAALRAGLPVTTSATTINRVCGSGLKAIMLAAAEIRAGDADVAVAGGMESMNLRAVSAAQRPLRLPPGRRAVVKDATVLDGLWCSIEDCHMGTHAERVATTTTSAGTTRTPSRSRAIGGRSRPSTPAGSRPRSPRSPSATPRAARRRSRSTKAPGATRPPRPSPASGRPSTCRNPSRASRRTGGHRHRRQRPRDHRRRGRDRRRQRARRRASHDLQPLARIVGYAQAEVEPKWLFLAPITGVRRLLERVELPLEAFDLIEINEAFAAQVLADGRELGFDWSKVNVNGGAIALGHPIGASGARVVATLLHELQRRQGRYGLATLCLGGGGSVAMAFERV